MRVKTFRSILLLLFLASIGKWGNAQQYNFYFPEVNKQLPQQFVYSLTTDHQGYLWIGTGEGLVKYDGTRLIPVRVGKLNSAVFCTSVKAIDKQVVAGFYDGTVAIGSDDRLTPLKNSANGKITGIAAAQGKIYVSSQNQLYEVKDGALKSVYNLGDAASINGISSTNSQLYIACSLGLVNFNPANNKTGTLVKTDIANVFCGEQHNYYLSDSSVYYFSGTNRMQKVCSLRGGNFIPGNPITGENGKLFISEGNVLTEIELSGYSVKHVNEFRLNNEELSLRAISIINGKVWLGTYGNGLAYFNPLTWSNYLSTNKKAEASVALVYHPGLALTEFTTSGATIYYQDGDVPNFSRSRKINYAGRTSCAAYLDDKYALIGTELGKVYKFDVSSSAFVASSFIEKELPGKAILAINTDRSNIYVSVAFNGVYVFSKQGQFLKHYNTENGLLHNDIFKVFTDREGYQWFVSRSSGLAILQDGEFQYLTLRDGLSSLEFTDITQDRNGAIWLSTEGGGLTSIAKGEIQNYDLESGLSSDYFYGMAAKDSMVYTYSRGSINILVGNKLRRIDSKELGITPNFSPRSIVVGNQWIAVGSEYGPVIQYLEQVFQDNSLKLLVKKVLVNDEKSWKAGTDFNYGDYKMEFLVEKINLDPFFQPDVEFMLVGHDKEWQHLDKQSVIYQSVQDNDYRFVVRDSSFPDNSFDFAFSVDKPIWKKPIYYLIGLAIIVVLIYIIFKIRLSQLRERNRELEQKVSERTTELRKKNSELEQFTFAMSHDLKNPAINMVELVRLLKSSGNYDEMTTEIVSQLSSVSGKMLNNLLDLIDLLKFANTQELPKEEVKISELIDNVKEANAQSITESNATINIDLQAFDSVRFNRSNLQSVFQNLISNAVKYRTPGVDAVISIKAYLSSGQQFISVTDNGLGMDLEANKDRLFGIFQRMHHHVEGSGIGLHLVKSIMEKHGGDVLVKSSPGEGTTFTLVFARQAG